MKIPSIGVAAIVVFAFLTCLAFFIGLNWSSPQSTINDIGKGAPKGPSLLEQLSPKKGTKNYNWTPFLDGSTTPDQQLRFKTLTNSRLCLTFDNKVNPKIFDLLAVANGDREKIDRLVSGWISEMRRLEAARCVVIEQTELKTIVEIPPVSGDLKKLILNQLGDIVGDENAGILVSILDKSLAYETANYGQVQRRVVVATPLAKKGEVPVVNIFEYWGDSDKPIDVQRFEGGIGGLPARWSNLFKLD